MYAIFSIGISVLIDQRLTSRELSLTLKVRNFRNSANRIRTQRCYPRMSVFTFRELNNFSKFSYTLDSLISACTGRIFSGFLGKETSMSAARKQHDGHCLFYAITKIATACEHESCANLCFRVIRSSIR